jgi:hypothetical protein
MFKKVKQYITLLAHSFKNKLSRWFKLKLFSISGKTLKQYFNIQRNLKWRVFFNMYILVTLIFCPYLDNMYQNWVEAEPYHMYYIVAVYSIFNLFFIRFFFVLPGFSFLLDVKKFLLKLKYPTAYYGFLKNEFKKYLFFLKNEKFSSSTKLLSAYVSYFFSKFLLWRPLFKRFSYFGNFRLTNSKFNKN